MKVSDYIIQQLADWGVKHVFLVVGGGAMHLNDSIRKELRITPICCHHEQAAAMAAEGYARIEGNLGVVNVTTGPGGINALTGVFGAWTDSIPMLILSGQVKRETSMNCHVLPGLRQLGDQEVNIVQMVEGITKYSVFVDNPLDIRYCLERAFYLARHGRPGPCWLDIPIDVQAAEIEPSDLESYDSTEDAQLWNMPTVRQRCAETLEALQKAQRPVILAGSGVRAANALEVFKRVIWKLQIPVVTAWAHDLVPSNHPLFCGRPGTIGDKAGNAAVQEADVLLILGSRLNIRQVSYNWRSFAPQAFKIQVDVDEAELDKPTVIPDLPIHCDLLLFLTCLEDKVNRMWERNATQDQWLSTAKATQRANPVVQPRQRDTKTLINPYHFMELLFDHLEADDVIVCGDASATIITFQVAQLKEDQRLISNSGCAPMGYDLPAAIGAAIARRGKRVICLAGDGSLQLNIQELQTLVHHNLPVKLIVLNNDGYLSMRQTQDSYFNGRIGADATSGISFPDYIKVGRAYGIRSMQIWWASALSSLWRELDTSGPSLIEILLDPKQGFEPRLRSKQLPDGTMVTPSLSEMS